MRTRIIGLASLLTLLTALLGAQPVAASPLPFTCTITQTVSGAAGTHSQTNVIASNVDISRSVTYTAYGTTASYVITCV